MAVPTATLKDGSTCYDTRLDRIERQADFIPAAVAETSGVTLAELRAKLIEERGETFGTTTIWRFFERRKITLKKIGRRRARAARRPETARGSPLGAAAISAGTEALWPLRLIRRPCVVDGVKPASDQALIAAGAEWRFAKNWTLMAKFEGDFGNGSRLRA
jgi:hypothetical protein